MLKAFTFSQKEHGSDFICKAEINKEQVLQDQHIETVKWYTAYDGIFMSDRAGPIGNNFQYVFFTYV